MLSNGNLPHHLFDLADELSLAATHIDNLLTLAVEADDKSILFTVHTCMQQYVSHRVGPCLGRISVR